MRVPVMIDASSCSATFDGTPMRQVSGKPVLGYILDSLQHCRAIGEIRVVTSDAATDDRLTSYCSDHDIACRRLPAAAAPEAIVEMIDELGSEAIVRLGADCPLLDHRLVDRAVQMFEHDLPDMVTNRVPCTFPGGEQVEVIGRGALAKRRTADYGKPPSLTGYIYDNSHRYQIRSFSAPRDLSRFELGIRCEADFANFVSTIMRMTRPHWSYTYEDSLALATGVLV